MRMGAGKFWETCLETRGGDAGLFCISMLEVFCKACLLDGNDTHRWRIGVSSIYSVKYPPMRRLLKSRSKLFSSSVRQAAAR